MENIATFSQPVLTLGATSFTAIQILMGCGALFILILLWLSARATHHARKLEQARLLADERTRDTEAHMSMILKSQAEMQGRMQTMAELFGARQAELNKSIRDRLDGMTNRLGNTINEQTRSTHENLSKLQERLAVIDTAQNNIQSLAGQVVQLQAILANKQTRGAFGQSRMETIIADGLPMKAFTFQATLSNGNRPDCLIKMPNGMPSLVIDAKFPLESWNEINDADAAEKKHNATIKFRRDMEVHIRDIASKYFITGETQDTAFLFVPSESIFAAIHEDFEPIVQRAQRARLVIVSPSLLMLSIQVIQSVLKDAKMREQAHLIQSEVIRLMEDIGRLDDRVRKLQLHFSQANRDIDDILISSAKVTKRGAKIEALELAQDEATQHPVKNPQMSPANKTDRSALAQTSPRFL